MGKRLLLLKAIVILLLLIPVLVTGDISVGSGKDYESFTQAVYETVDSGEKITVFPGQYDIREEYENLFGDDVPETFSKGIFLHDRDVLFLPGSKLTCIWNRDDVFSVIYSGGNVVIDGLNLYAEGMEYAIHDDLWYWPEPYVNEYRYCRIIGRMLKNANCIGGGVARNARIIIDNCYFDNGVDGSITVRYHNTDLPKATGEIWISDSYFNGYLAMCYYGSSSHLDVYVNGCKAQRIGTKKETPDSLVENIDLYIWNNDTAEVRETNERTDEPYSDLSFNDLRDERTWADIQTAWGRQRRNMRLHWTDYWCIKAHGP